MDGKAKGPEKPGPSLPTKDQERNTGTASHHGSRGRDHADESIRLVIDQLTN